MKYPIIVIGMHRSGTGIVARTMEDAGLFVGKRLQRDHEPLFFVALNKWLLRICHGAWDEAKVIHHLLADEEQCNLTTEYLTRLIRSPRCAEFLGIRRFARYRALCDVKEPWGWKDPRNTFTLPLWKILFPRATVVHVYRHGVDVAQSLRKRQQTNLSDWVQQRSWAQNLAWLRPKKGGFSDSVRCSSLEGGFSLWLEYMHEAKMHVNAFGDDALEVQYETLLEQPIHQLSRIAEFCELRASRDKLELAAERLEPARAFAYLNDHQLRDFATRKRRELSEFGYDDGSQ